MVHTFLENASQYRVSYRLCYASISRRVSRLNVHCTEKAKINKKSEESIGHGVRISIHGIQGILSVEVIFRNQDSNQTLAQDPFPVNPRVNFREELR